VDRGRAQTGAERPAWLTRAERGADRLGAFLRRPVPTWSIASLCLAAIAVHWTNADPDLFARVAVGRIVERNGAVLATDPFAFTARKALWVDHEWLSGIVFYHLSQWGGDRLLFLFKIVVMLGAVGLLASAQRRRAEGDAAAFPWLLLTVVPAAYVWLSTVRAQVFTYLLIPLFLLVFVLYRRDRDRRLLWLLPPLMLLWANAHGGFVVGLGFLGLFAVAALREGRSFALPLWMALGGCTAVTLVNPYGFEYWVYLAGALTMDRPTITEWQSVGPTSLPGIVMLLYAAVFLAGARLSERRPPVEALLMSGASCLFAFRSLRLAAVFFMVLAVYGTDSFAALLLAASERWSRTYTALRRVLTAYVALGILFLLTLVVPFAVRFGSFRLDYGFYPFRALEWLARNRSGGDLLVGFNYGSFALWRLYPRFRVSLDGRYEEVYPDSTFLMVAAALDSAAPDHASSLERVDPDYVLLPAGSEAYEEPARFGPGWRVLYRDEGFLVLGREPPRGAAEIRPGSGPATADAIEADAAAGVRDGGGAQAGSAAPGRPIWEPGF
jgi:hypothetical protein